MMQPDTPTVPAGDTAARPLELITSVRQFIKGLRGAWTVNTCTCPNDFRKDHPPDEHTIWCDGTKESLAQLAALERECQQTRDRLALLEKLRHCPDVTADIIREIAETGEDLGVGPSEKEAAAAKAVMALWNRCQRQEAVGRAAREWEAELSEDCDTPNRTALRKALDALGSPT